VLIKVTKDCLVSAQQHLLKAVSANSLTPILAGINIQASAEHLILTASNISMTVQFTIPYEHNRMTVQRAGGIVVPARYFNEIVRRLEAGVITLETKDDHVMSITSGHSQIRLCGMDSAEYPFIEQAEANPANKLRVHNGLLKRAIKQVAAAASTSEARPVLTGISVELNNDSLNLSATDGIRLASTTMRISHSSPINAKAIIPGKNLLEVSKMLKDDDITEIEFGSRQVKFITNELRVRTALIDGAFPAVNNIIPPSHSGEIEVETALLLHAVGRASVLAGDSIVRLIASTGKLALLSNASDIGDVRDEVPLAAVRGEPFTVSMNGKLLLDIIRCIDYERVLIKYAGKTSPIVIIPMDAHSSTLFLLTPVRTHH